MENDLTVINFASFKNSFHSLGILHKECGAICPHLRRFFERINFNTGLQAFKEISDSRS